MDGIRWDGTEAGFEDLCVWPPVGQIALSLCNGSHVVVPTRTGCERLFPGEWLVRLPNGEIHVDRAVSA